VGKVWEIFTDGASSGNPGPAAIGVVIKENGETVKTMAKDIGIATNNVAEYSALIFALQEALVQKVDEVSVKTDSELVYKQLIGEYQIKHDQLKLFFDQIQQLLKGFKVFKIQHVPREQNKEADKLAQKAVIKIAKEQAKVVASRPESRGEESPSSAG
jgi:ribonuclease HI